MQHHLESYYEIEYSTIEQPKFWRAIGDRQKSFVETSEALRKLMDKERIASNRLVHSFRIVERRYHVTTEEIKTFSML